jgi:hypothetical protein
MKLTLKKVQVKNPEGSGRRLYTDEDPKDTVGISFKTKEDIVDTLNKTSFKTKSHARQSQIINLIHQRVRAAYSKSKDPEVKSRLKRALDYIESRKESSKAKTQRLNKMKEASNPQAGTALPYGSGFAPIKEYSNTGPSTPKVYIVKADGNYKEVPIGILSKISNLTYDMGGGETNYYPEKNIVIIDNIPIEEFVKDPGEIKDEKIYVEYNLNQSYSFPKANKILVAQLVYHLDDVKSFAKTVANSLKDGGVIEFFSDVMSKEDKMFLEYLSSEFKFGIPSTLSKYKNTPIKITTNKYIPPTEYYIYEVTDDVGNISKISTTKKGSWWKYVKVEGNLNFKPIEGLNPEHYNQLGLEPNKALKKQLEQFSDILGYNIIKIKKLNENLKETVTDTEVICDNCGWEWAIKDGGKDLYVCHKCGHDNTPKSDPFGLNELAKQFGEEVGRDLTKGWNPQKDFVSLSIFMIDNGMNIKPLPKIKVIKDDEENASLLLGKTAYYDPNNQSITLYTMNRHPKDVLRSFAHEMVHHEQNLEGRLNNINTTNTNEDGNLPEIEKEAYEKGNMMLRNWEDSIKNPVKEHILYIPKFNKPLTLTENLWKTLNEISLNPNNAAELEGDLYKGMFKAGNKTYTYDIYRIENPYKDGKEFYNVEFHPKNNPISTPTGDTTKEDYIKILNTMYKIILDFAEADEPDYIGIASMEGSSNKNYHKVYNNLTDNKFNNIPGYFRKDANLEFDTPQGKGRFVVLKRKNV